MGSLGDFEYPLVGNDDPAVISGFKRVCIVGAGVTGLCVCKHLLQHGVDSVVVLEKEESVGGVWRNTFASTTLQTHKEAYQFSDFPWPAGTRRYPTHLEVMDYLHSYATKFHIMKRVQFSSRVTELRRLGVVDKRNWLDVGPACCANWEIQFRRAREAVPQLLYCEFLVLCVGHFGDVPRLPRYNYNTEDFRGQVLHSMDYGKLDDKAAQALLTGKRVVVVGLRKSALDVAMEAAVANSAAAHDGESQSACTIVFRTPHWVNANDKAFGVPLGSLVRTRFSDLLVPKQGQPLLRGIISTLLTPLRWAISAFVELHLLRTLPLRQLGMVPDTRATFLEEFKSCKLTLAPPHFFEACVQRRILLRRTPEWSFAPDGVRLANGEVVQADLVVLCTGFEGQKKLESLLGPKEFANLFKDHDNVIPLYRGVIPPHVPHLAIVGFQEGYSNVFNAEMGARWLAHLLSSKITLPSVQQMAMVAQQWARDSRVFTSNFNTKACSNPMVIWQADHICRDIGWNPRRKKGILKELFEPYSNMDYKDE
ncbi:hypothetical protein L7F22_011816 [Adiantum nelumboides]|nr:hypothetical protein [Adiantum nelumboides]